ncbi:MAG: hypothetical protein V4555_07565 [Acidobacteriota bacterium]
MTPSLIHLLAAMSFPAGAASVGAQTADAIYKRACAVQDAMSEPKQHKLQPAK